MRTSETANLKPAPTGTLPARDAKMRAAYGFGLFALPRYREASLGRWRIVLHLASLGDGYASGPMIEPTRYVLYDGRTAWMSTGLLEQESHAFHVDQAKGLVVAAGLGMGMFAYAACAKREVERVIIVERTPEVISLMRQAAGMDEWPGRDKLIIVQADALAADLARRILAEGPRPDYLFADIWPTCAALNAPMETAAMVSALRPKAAGWWGQELSFGLWCRGRQRLPDKEALGEYAFCIGVPIPVSPGYIAFCADVIDANLPSASRASGFSRWRERWQRALSATRRRSSSI